MDTVRNNGTSEAKTDVASGEGCWGVSLSLGALASVSFRVAGWLRPPANCVINMPKSNPAAAEFIATPWTAPSVIHPWGTAATRLVPIDTPAAGIVGSAASIMPIFVYVL